MKRLFFACFTLLIYCLGNPAKAQRTSDGVLFIGASPIISIYSKPSGGLEVNVGEYIFNSYWKAGVSAVNWMQKAGNAQGTLSGVVFDHTHWKAKGGWFYRIYGTYNRIFSMYLGASAFLGCNSYYTFRPLPQELRPEYSTEFIYGIEPELDFEVFVSPRTAIIAGIQSPFTFSSSLKSDLWHLTASVGVRINL